MKLSLFRLTYLALVVAAATGAACATSQEIEQPPPDPGVDLDSGPPVVVPTPPVDAADAGEDADAGPICSPAGWCNVPLPDTFLAATDIWPLAERAFVLAKSPYVGVKILEWTEATGQWKTIDDDSQNAIESGRDPSNIWAPSDDEVYFSLASGYVFHGARSASGWTWTKYLFPTCADARLWVAGSSATDVYVGSCATIYRKGNAGDAGDDAASAPPGWIADHVEDVSTGAPSFSRASASGPDDLWFAGVRRSTNGAQCGLVLHKTSAGYERVADGTPVNATNGCDALPGLLTIGGSVDALQAIDHATMFGLVRDLEPTRITADGDGGYARVRGKFTVLPNTWSSAWTASATAADVWLSADTATGQVVHATDLWGDAAAAYPYSSIALNGAPILQPIVQIRGTSSTNLWAVGGSYALHKTTP